MVKSSHAIIIWHSSLLLGIKIVQIIIVSLKYAILVHAFSCYDTKIDAIYGHDRTAKLWDTQTF